MENLIDFNFKGNSILGVETTVDNSKSSTCVIFVHGIPGDRVDARRINVKIARNLAEKGISSIRVDFLASGVSEGRYLDVSYDNYKLLLDEIVTYADNKGFVKIYLLAFSDAAKIALSYVQQSMFVNNVIMCNGIIDNESATQYTPFRRVKRVGKEFAVDIGCGVWINTKLLKETINLDIDAVMENNTVYAIFGKDDVLSFSSINLLKERGYGNIRYIEGADHLFTSKKWEDALISDICSIFNNRN